jgi:hypothetical protein
MRIRTCLLGALLVLGLAVSGCGGDDSDKSSKSTSATGSSNDSSKDSGDDSSSESLDVCGMLTPADLQGAFGSPFEQGELTHQEQTGGDQCVWTNTDAPPVKTFSLTVLRQDSLDGAIKASGLSVEELHEQTKAVYPDAEPIDLGDDAYLAKTELAVLDGETLYSFSTFLGTSDEAIAGMKTLAAKVVG